MSERGSATILTLLISAVILTVAIGFNWIVKEHLKAAEGLKIKAEGMVEARSTYDSLIYSILSGQLTQKEILFSGEQTVLGIKRIPLGKNGIRLANGIFVQIQDSSSLVSLVTPDVEVLKRLAGVVGAPQETLNSLADSFLDWIDPDDLKRINGAESFYYQTEGKPYVPRNSPIQYKAELAFIRGMDSEIYAKMEPYLTILPSMGFNPNTASDVTLMAYLDIDKDTVEKLKNYVAQRPIIMDSEIFALIGKIPKRDPEGFNYFPSPFFEITVTVGNPKSIYTLNAGVDIRPTPTSPYGVIYWTEG
jgi:general secretion pathway protein K